MKIEPTFLRSKVARRIFTLFILCALMPVLALAIMAFSQVTKQLEKQSQRRLHQSCKTLGMSIFERLSFLEQQLENLSFDFKTGSGISPDWATNRKLPTENLKKRFKGLVLITNSGTYNTIFGDIQSPSGQFEEEKKHLTSGKTVVLTGSTAKDDYLHIYMMRAVDLQDQKKGILFAEINPMYLWGLNEYNTLPSMSELCVLDQSNNVIYSTLSLPSSFHEKLLFKMSHSSLGSFEWNYEDEEYLANFWSIPLKFAFFHSKWVVVMSASKTDILAPMTYFKKTFPFVILLTLLVVSFLSTIQIRRNMRPIVILRNATQKIAQGFFEHKVKIKSGDEFESLGEAFNQMSKKIKEGQTLLVQAAKMSAIGQMAAGIIHEVKQPLTAIHGLLDLSLMDEKPGKTKERLESTMGQVKRLNNMLGKFKSFSHMSEEKMGRISLNTVIVQVYELFEHQFLMGQIHCHMATEENMPDILGDKQGLQQVLTNLLINAVDALEEKNDGQRTIKIKTYSSEDKVFVEVGDNGCGIPEEIQARIFDPFFTTKDEDKGTGLGMAIIESILHKHEASIKVESEVGTGTKFTIIFSNLAQAVHDWGRKS